MWFNQFGGIMKVHVECLLLIIYLLAFLKNLCMVMLNHISHSVYVVRGEGREVWVFLYLSAWLLFKYSEQTKVLLPLCASMSVANRSAYTWIFFFNYRLFCVWVYITQNFHFCRTWSERAQATAVSVSLPSCISFCFSPFLHFLHWPGSLRFYFPVFTVFTINSVFRVQETDSFSLLWQCGVDPFCRI